MITNEQIQELKLLSQFSIDTTLTGIKVHSSEAADQTVAAAQRLFDKGLTDQFDGGYLTERGIEAAVHAQGLMSLLAD